MTKRFVLYEHKGDYYILKNPRLHLDFIEMLGDALTSEEIVEELNQLDERVVELAEENEQLKKYLKIHNESELSSIEYNLKLYEENEKLRHELDSLTGCYCADNKEFKDYWRIGYDD